MSDILLADACLALIGEMGLSADKIVAEKIVAYLNLLSRWNQVHNLTAVRSIDEMLFRHVLDSLSVVPYLQGPKIADVGSGAGLPGIPLAIYFPNYQFHLIECAPKRVAFLREVVRALSLENVSVVASRVEALQDQVFSSIVTRAFAKLPKMLQLVRHLCDNQSKILAMKGSAAAEEISQLPRWALLEQAPLVSIPTKDWQHHILVIKMAD